MAFNRRTFLARACLTALGWNIGTRGALASVTVADSKSDSSNHLLISIFLRGGADGLSLVPPIGEDSYYRARPTLAIDKRTAISINDLFGLHPAMASLEPIYKSGEMAIVHACGSDDRTLSHFDAMATMERGLRRDPNSGTASGWLARHLALTEHEGASPLRAIAVGDVTPQSLAGTPSQTTFRSIDDLNVDFTLGGRNKSALSAIHRLYDGVSKTSVGEAGLESLSALQRLSRISFADYKPRLGANYPKDDLSTALRQAAMLAKARVGLEVACLDQTGYDTHVAQGGAQGLLASQLKSLADGIAALRLDLGPTLWANTTVVVQSEFGRRVEENSGLGTDHGRGGVMMVLGGDGIHGGKVYGEWPSLEPGKLDSDGNLLVTTDYRNVLAEVLTKRCGNKHAEMVFPGLDYRPQGLAA